MSTISVINVAGEIEPSYIEALEKNEHSVRSVTSANVAAAIEKTDVIIIYNDVQQNMGEVCRLILKIREEATSAVWVFSKQNSETDRLLYLQLGANHNLDKECPPEELQLIVKNEVKQNQLNSVVQNTKNVGMKKGKADIQLNVKNQSIINTEGIEVELTKLEYKLMSLLFHSPDETVVYEELYLQLWQEEQKHSKARIANLVFHLRTKFQENGVLDIDVKTVRSQGYRLIQY